MAIFGSRLGVSYRTALSGCTRDDGTGGASGLYRWTPRVGIPVQALEVPLVEAAAAFPRATGNCVITMGNGPWSPTGAKFEGADWQKIRQWLERGNTLLIVTDDPGELPAEIRRDLLAPGAMEVAGDSSSKRASGSVENHPELSSAALRDRSGEALTVQRDGPRWKLGNSAEHPGEGAAAEGSSTERAGTGWQLAEDARGGVLFRVPAGQGSIYLLLDAYAWTNAGLDQGENAAVLAGILEREIHGGVLAMDEYRHGHGRSESFLSFLLHLPGASSFFWLSALWALVYFVGRNVRLRPVETFVEIERRSAREYIDAVAQLYERARAAPLVAEAVARRLRQVARSSADQPQAVEAILRRAEEYTSGAERPARPTTAIRLVQDLIRLRKEVYGTRTVS